MQKEKVTLYCHFFLESAKGVVKTMKLVLEGLSLHVIDLKSRIAKLLETQKSDNTSLFKLVSINKTVNSQGLMDSMKVSQFFEDKDDVFCQVELNVQPIKTVMAKNTEIDELLTYKPLQNYSFYVANKQIVRVLVPLKGVESLSKENLIAKFTDQSLEVKVHGLNNLNYFFRVPKLDAKIVPDKSEALFDKNGNIVIRLRKEKEDDHWSYLYKQKYVGE
jgi:hypothetical protein